MKPWGGCPIDWEPKLRAFPAALRYRRAESVLSRASIFDQSNWRALLHSTLLFNFLEHYHPAATDQKKLCRRG